ncbi:MAG: NAD(P)/FAD-dependent oxidoreductase [Candidatus Acidiferrum sp.]
MPTLFTALLAKKGAMPAARLSPGQPVPKPAFAANLFSEIAAPARPKAPAGSTVLIIGGGFAGLAAANELFHAGYEVTVLEAQPKLGGRVVSVSDFMPGKVVESGGELIGDNHPAWLSYAAQFGLGLSPVDDGGNAPVFLRGRRLTEKQAAQLADEMEKVFEKLAALAKSIRCLKPWESDGAEDYDGQSLGSWLCKQRDVSELASYAVALQFATDNGVEADRQSLLGVLTMIRGGGQGLAYFTETERHRCIGGNQQLALKLAEPILNRLHLGFAVHEVQKTGNGEMAVTGSEWTRHPEKPLTFQAKDVILAIPPSVWSRIKFDREFPRGKPQMGRNVKCLMRFQTEFWKRSRLSPNLTSDRTMELTWQATEGQKGPGQVLVGFSGAGQADDCARWKPEERTGNYARELARAYRGARENLADLRLKNWPEDPFVKASYAFPAPGDILRWGPIFHQGLGRLHFAGEHTAYDFIGYMEGALESGIRVARCLTDRDKLTIPATGG